MKTARRIKNIFQHDFRLFLNMALYALIHLIQNGKKPGAMQLVFTFIVMTTLYPVLSPDPNQIARANVAKENIQQQTGPYEIYLPVARCSEGWPMVAANPQRTSWTPEEVTGNLQVEWYRPIEAYIPQNVQVIASRGFLYVATAKGLYTLNAANGEVAWRFDTEMPLGNSPTVVGGVVYVGGYDRKLHALDAVTGTHLWAFEGAQAGFSTNPLVIDGRIFAGNRDGYMYAIGAHGTVDQGRLLWKYRTGGPIHLSPAYQNGVIFFAAGDNHAYALFTETGNLVWKSKKLPGDGYHSYWPVIYQDKVIFSGASSYRTAADPGTKSVPETPDYGYSNIFAMERDSLWPSEPDGTLIGEEVYSQPWAQGYPILDLSRITEYLEDNPTSDPYKHKPWRRVIIVLNTRDGNEYTFDSDSDGYPEYLPVTMWGTHNGNRYPPIVGPNEILYVSNIYQKLDISRGIVMGWNPATPSYMSILGGNGAIDEPQALSSGGHLIYRSLCCDRVGDYFDTRQNGIRNQTVWSYNLDQLAPGYDEMWTILPGLPRLQGWYKGISNSINSAYHNHGDQNPLIPYNGRLYIHRSNAIIAFGTGPALGKLPLLPIQSTTSTTKPLTIQDLTTRLEDEVQKMLAAGPLRPGYFNNSQFAYKAFVNYFENPGDTLYTLSRAYPYLSPELQSETRTYLRREFQEYFDPVMYSSIGWADGAAREAMPLPPEVEAALESYPKTEFARYWSWLYPQHNFYTMWKYAQIFPEDARRIYDLAKSRLQVPVPEIANSDYFLQAPYEHNAYIAGYIGFLNLQDLAGMSGIESQLRSSVINELNRLLQLKANIFTKNSYFGMDDFNYWKHLDIARNFIFLIPELGDYMNQNMLARVQEALDEYEYIAQYWFVSRYESAIGETAISHLYNYGALFQAKAYVLKVPRDVLTQYLDVPAFAVGDLFYIQNLVAAIEAP